MSGLPEVAGSAPAWTEDEPRPSYYTDSEAPLGVPAYSLVPRGSDVPLHPGARELFNPDSSNRLWQYSTKHMSIDLGARLWGMNCPTYGLHGQIAGTVQIFGLANVENIEEISLILEGMLDAWIPTAASASHHTLTFLSHAVPVRLCAMKRLSNHTRSYEFSIPIPSEVNVQGVNVPTPASFFQDRYGLICEIIYSLKVNLQGRRKNRTLKSLDSKTINLLYLPKSRPTDPPLCSIPRPTRAHGGQTPGPNFQVSDHVSAYALSPWWWSIISTENCKGSLDTFKDTVFFSIPSPHTFASGEKIPFLLSFVFPNNPVLSILYAQRVSIKLLKQLVVYPPKPNHTRRHHRARHIFKRSRSANSRLETRKHSPHHDVSAEDVGTDEERASRFSSPSSESESDSTSRSTCDPVIREWAISSGQLRFKSEYAEGVCVLRGWIDGALPGRECSWSLGSVARVQYVIRVFVNPPDHLEEHLPRFTFEQMVELTTDAWEVDDRELRSMGGLPAPALGLVKESRGEQ